MTPKNGRAEINLPLQKLSQCKGNACFYEIMSITKYRQELHRVTPPVHPSHHTCPVSRTLSMKYERSHM